ncbi:MAG: major Facilitator Superfamily protein [Rhizobium sp.]|nr:major Facilitator Superfamily protein [Rhizobium sp.]
MTPAVIPPATSGIRSLFDKSRISATALLGAAIGLEALEFYVTASLMPSMVRDIGGLSLLAWTTSLYVAAIVLGSIAVVIRPQSANLNQVYVTGALIFAAGCLIIGLAPNMIVVLLGRFVQGLGAGLLATMGYSFIRFVYPAGMQNAASAFYSALWGVSTLLGPSIGGVFSHGSHWRWAFLILIPLALMMAMAAPRLLPPGKDERQKQALPLTQIVLILAGILMVSFAGTVETDRMRAVLVLAGAMALAGLIVSERKLAARLLPRSATVITHPLSLAYLAMFLLIIVLNSDIYVPYFLQTMHATSPLAAGYIVALVATGWTAAGITTASWRGRSARLAILAGPAVIVVSTITLAFVIARENSAANLAVLTAICLCLFGMGAGVGLGWAHLVSIGLTRAAAGEDDKAPAAINLVQSLAAAFGAAIAGVIANGVGLVTPGGVAGGVAAAFWLYGLVSLAGLAALLVAVPLSRMRDGG